MEKLKLNLDDLTVESFETTPESRSRQGTVFGFDCTEEASCIDYTCGTCPGQQPAECQNPTATESAEYTVHNDFPECEEETEGGEPGCAGLPTSSWCTLTQSYCPTCTPTCSFC